MYSARVIEHAVGRNQAGENVVEGNQSRYRECWFRTSLARKAHVHQTSVRPAEATRTWNRYQLLPGKWADRLDWHISLLNYIEILYSQGLPNLIPYRY